jgi:hypothetical protein
MALNFADIANKKLDELERPKNPPVGTYLCQITKVPSVGTLPGDEWDTVDVPMKVIAATEDVDADAIAEFGDVTKIYLRHRFMISKTDENEFNKGVNQVRRFCEEHVKSATPEMSLTEALNSTVNQQVLASVIWKADKRDAEVMHANVGRTAPVDA